MESKTYPSLVPRVWDSKVGSVDQINLQSGLPVPQNLYLYYLGIDSFQIFIIF